MNNVAAAAAAAGYSGSRTVGSGLRGSQGRGALKSLSGCIRSSGPEGGHCRVQVQAEQKKSTRRFGDERKDPSHPDGGGLLRRKTGVAVGGSTLVPAPVTGAVNRAQNPQ